MQVHVHELELQAVLVQRAVGQKHADLGQPRRDAFGRLDVDLALDLGIQHKRLAGQLANRFGDDIDIGIDKVERDRRLRLQLRHGRNCTKTGGDTRRKQRTRQAA